MVYDQETIEEYLEHHQTKGSHWGVRNGPPYPLRSSQMTRMQKRFNKELLKQKEKLEKKKAKVQEKEERAQAKKAYKESKRRHGKKKKKDGEFTPLTAEQKLDALKYNRVGEIYKHRAEFSTNELNDAINRFEKEAKIKEYYSKSIKTRWDQLEDMGNKIEKIGNFAGKAGNAYNNMVPIINAATGSELKKLGEKSNKNKNNNKK